MTAIVHHAKKPNPANPRRFFSRPTDRSLAAYKAWISGMYKAVMGQAGLPIEEEDITEAEWVSSWKSFWKGAEREPRKE